MSRPKPLVAGRYRLLRVIGRGGMGIVFNALDETEDEQVAIKVLKPAALANKTIRRRFFREAEITARLTHPHLVQVKDWGEDDKGNPYLVSEYLQGVPLSEELRQRGKLPVSEALVYLMPIIGGLAYAHGQGVIHRDVKPSNIVLVDGPGGTVSSKLIDFGIALAADTTRLTASHAIVGTRAYLAPEQVLRGDIGPSVDLWAMGLVLFYTLSGSNPYARGDITKKMKRMVSEPVPSLRKRVPRLSAGFCAAVERALEYNLDRRYADMPSLARALLFSAAASAIGVPQSPDPIGLPEWESWHKAACSEGSETLDW